MLSQDPRPAALSVQVTSTLRVRPLQSQQVAFSSIASATLVVQGCTQAAGGTTSPSNGTATFSSAEPTSSRRPPRVGIAPGLRASPLLAHRWDMAASVKDGLPSGGASLALSLGDAPRTLTVTTRAARTARASWTAAVSGAVVVEAAADGGDGTYVQRVQVRAHDAETVADFIRGAATANSFTDRAGGDGCASRVRRRAVWRDVCWVVCGNHE